MPSKPYHVNVHDLPRQSRFGGAMEETAVVMDNAMLKFSWAQPMGPQMTGRDAAEGHAHSHPWDQSILLISGKVEVTLGGEETFVLEPGHVIYIPANVSHIGRVLSDEPAFGVDIFAPVVEDYLDMAQHQLTNDSATA